jgi:hypothetical protein
MKNMGQHKKFDEYLKDLKRWQDNMYSPGAYTGGNIHPAVRHGNKKILKIYTWVIISIFLIGLAYGFFDFF